jgi:perosamine synthetase
MADILMRQVAMSAPDIQPEDIALVVQVLESGQLSLGPFQERLERAFAAYVGTEHAVAVSSGTAGLHLCMAAAEIAPGDEVITTPFSFVASANCILFERGTPVFVDIDEASMTLDPAAVAAAVTGRTRVVLPVHVFGQPCEMDALQTICRAHDLLLIEDACEALGAEFRGRKVGTFGQAAVFAGYANKQLTMGEGGIITTDDARWATKLRSLRNQGRNEMGTWLHHERLGFNYRLDEMSAALGYSQLARIDRLLARRSAAAACYAEHLQTVPGVILLSAVPTTTHLSWFVLIVRLEEWVDRNEVIEQLRQRGIPTRTYFSSIHLQPYFRERFDFREGDFPVTERVARSTLALPFHTNITEADIAYVTLCLKEAIELSRPR